MPTACSRPSRPSLRSAPLALLLLSGLLGAACQKTSGPRAARDDLALAPRETDIVLTINLKRVRGSVLWKKLIEFRDKDPNSKKQYDDFVKKCHFDPLNQIDSIFLALPQSVDQSREFALVARGAFNEAELVSCMRQTAKENQGKEVTETPYLNHKLYTVGGQEGAFAVLDSKLAIMGGREWSRKLIDQHENRVPGNGAKDHKELTDLVRRTQQGDGIWGAGLVPPSVTEKLKSNPQLGSAASMKSIFGSVDLGKGMSIRLNLDLAGDAEAGELSAKVKDQLASARKNPRVQVLGLGAYFDAIKVAAAKNTFTTAIDLSQPQVDDLLTRLSGLLGSLSLGD